MITTPFWTVLRQYWRDWKTEEECLVWRWQHAALLTNCSISLAGCCDGVRHLSTPLLLVARLPAWCALADAASSHSDARARTNIADWSSVFVEFLLNDASRVACCCCLTFSLHVLISWLQVAKDAKNWMWEKFSIADRRGYMIMTLSQTTTWPTWSL